MQKLRLLVALPVATILTLSGYGAASLLAGASSSPATYYACLASGNLSKVGTKARVCPQGSKLITWNQVGPSGTPGAKGDTGAPGAKGDTGPAGLSASVAIALSPSISDSTGCRHLEIGEGVYSCPVSTTLNLNPGQYLLEGPCLNVSWSGDISISNAFDPSWGQIAIANVGSGIVVGSCSMDEVTQIPGLPQVLMKATPIRP